VTLVHAGDPGAASADMVEHPLGDFEPHPEALQAGRNRSTQIMCASGHNRREVRAARRSLRTGVKYGLVECVRL
jgi:hypothetical protein